MNEPNVDPPVRLPPGEGAVLGAALATEYFKGRGDVHGAMLQLARRLEEAEIPYAVAGALGLFEHGYRRMTTDVDLLVTADGLARFKARWLGRGYVERFAGSKGVRDAEHDVAVDFLIAGDFPGDGKPKPLAFPDPAAVAVGGPRVKVLPLPRLVELKLASGMTAPHRLKDLADVVETVRALDLPAAFGGELHPWVRPKFDELWAAAQHGRDEDY
jgi:hypothetical protein